LDPLAQSAVAIVLQQEKSKPFFNLIPQGKFFFHNPIRKWDI
jgi:hypothetical protein